jgi:serine/threonine protein kinase
MIVLELCKYGALRDCLKHFIPWNLRVRMLLDIAQGINAMHENSIIHRYVMIVLLMVCKNTFEQIKLLNNE